MKPSAPEKSTVAANRNWEPSHLMEQKSETYAKCVKMYPGVRIAISTLDKVEKSGPPIGHPGTERVAQLTCGPTVRSYGLSSRNLIISAYRGRVSVSDDELEKERKRSLEEIQRAEIFAGMERSSSVCAAKSGKRKAVSARCSAESRGMQTSSVCHFHAVDSPSRTTWLPWRKTPVSTRPAAVWGS